MSSGFMSSGLLARARRVGVRDRIDRSRAEEPSDRAGEELERQKEQPDDQARGAQRLHQPDRAEPVGARFARLPGSGACSECALHANGNAPAGAIVPCLPELMGAEEIHGRPGEFSEHRRRVRCRSTTDPVQYKEFIA